MTEFAMVEELACLVKDNLPCKHLVLSMEEAFVNFLRHDTSSNGLMELEPMNPYQRLLLHRLADIFGFSHKSVGEGDERHLILERCPETSIPSILVSDLLWQYDDSESLVALNQLSRKIDASSPALQSKSHKYTLAEREAAYLAARERIFGEEKDDVQEDSLRQKPRTVPMVARRMIVHALGQNARTLNVDSSLPESSFGKGLSTKHDINQKNMSTAQRDTDQEIHCFATPNVHIFQKVTTGDNPATGSSNSIKLSNGGSGAPQNEKSTPVIKEHMKVENLGAARRMFASALGLQSTKKEALDNSCKKL